MGGRFELLELQSGGRQGDNCPFVSVHVRIIRSREYRDRVRQFSGGHVSVLFEPIVDDLVGSDEARDPVRVEEPAEGGEAVHERGLAEGVWDIVDRLPRVDLVSAERLPAIGRLDRVAPEQVAQRAARRRLLEPVDCRDVVDGGDVRADSAVDCEEGAEPRAADHRSEGQAVEQLNARDVEVFARVLVVDLEPEGHELGHHAGLMVPAKEPHVQREADLHREEVEENLRAEVAAVDVVSEEQKLPLQLQLGHRSRGSRGGGRCLAAHRPLPRRPRDGRGRGRHRCGSLPAQRALPRPRVRDLRRRSRGRMSRPWSFGFVQDVQEVIKLPVDISEDCLKLGVPPPKEVRLVSTDLEQREGKHDPYV